MAMPARVNTEGYSPRIELGAKFSRVKTRLIWRKEAPQAKVLALCAVLLESRQAERHAA